MALTWKELHRLFRGGTVLHLATQGSEGPHVAPVFYCALESPPRLCWVSAVDAQHSRHLESEPRVAGGVTLSEKLTHARGLQVVGRARRAGEAELAGLRSAYMKRFPLAAPVLLADRSAVMFVLDPRWVRLVEKRLGIDLSQEWTA